MTMPGVGHVIALTFMSAIDDPERFRRSKDVGPWVGLTPGRDQSGERDIVGGITKAGDAGLRAALYQAATVMLNHGGPNWLKSWAQRLTKLRGKKRATVALARRIGVVLHRMWRNGTEFRFTREAAMALQTVVKHATLTPRNYAISIGYSADRRPTTAPNNSPPSDPPQSGPNTGPPACLTALETNFLKSKSSRTSPGTVRKPCLERRRPINIWCDRKKRDKP